MHKRGQQVMPAEDALPAHNFAPLRADLTLKARGAYTGSSRHLVPSMPEIRGSKPGGRTGTSHEYLESVHVEGLPVESGQDRML
jgi:hypothetical protein